MLLWVAGLSVSAVTDSRWLLLAACIGAGVGVLVYRLLEHWPYDPHCSAGCG